MEKCLSEITRQDWIAWQWQEITSLDDEDRRFMRGQKRTPDEALQAMEEWDATAEERAATE
jgi:hypothetical protein